MNKDTELKISKANNGWTLNIEIPDNEGYNYEERTYVFTSTKDLEEFLSNTFKEMEEEKEQAIDEN